MISSRDTAVQPKYLSPDFDFSDVEPLRSCYDEMLERRIADPAGLERLILDANELGRGLEEDAAWRYIRMTCDTGSEKFREDWNHFLRDIEPVIKPLEFSLSRKIHKSEHFAALDPARYAVFARELGRQIELYREENVALEAEIEEAAAEYGRICGEMSVKVDGEVLTLQQAALKLLDRDRDLRESTWRAIWERRAADAGALDDLLERLMELRQRVALNAGFQNFRDFQHRKLGRFDYSSDDCLRFHEAVQRQVLPLLRRWDENRRDRLKLNHLRPWDTKVDVYGDLPLSPFEDADELTEKAQRSLAHLDPEFTRVIEEMRRLDRLDLASRVGKAPGGYNYPLYNTGYPFIFMNAVGSQGDLCTMVHEAGHAVHAMLTHGEPLCIYKDIPSEAAELASMAMELLSMAHWDEFYSDPGDLRRARRQQLERTMDVLPWVATVDAFQHWLYTHPGHSLEERRETWEALERRFETGLVDWSGLEDQRRIQYHRQLHIFETPFYYIEYAIAQLGALQIWTRSLEDPAAALRNYKRGLSLGYTRPLPEIYAACGIRFDFSEETVGRLVETVGEQYERLG